MTVYEHLSLLTASAQLAGQAYIDTVTVIFAIMLTGYFAGNRLNRTMLIMVIGTSALFVGPMIGIVGTQLARVTSLSLAVPLEHVDAMPFLAKFVSFGIVTNLGSGFLTVPPVMAYIGAIVFVIHCRQRGTVTADSA